MRQLHALLLAAGFLHLSSCLISRDVVNEPLKRERFTNLVPGTTTAREVVEHLGAPNEVVQLGNRTAYRYDFTITKRAVFSVIIVSFLNEDTRSDRAWLFFDSKDVLTQVGTTLDAGDAEYAMPWQRVHGH